ncbi:MAG: hypothetical protein ACREV1_06415 [Gammaproteobacteria bacterium]
MDSIHPDEVQDILQGAKRMVSALTQIDSGRVMQMQKSLDKARADLKAELAKLEETRRVQASEKKAHEDLMRDAWREHTAAMKAARKEHAELSATLLRDRDEAIKGYQRETLEHRKQVEAYRKKVGSEMLELGEKFAILRGEFEAFRERVTNA